MKKIFMIICLFCGFVGNSWAVCELTESTDRTPSDEDLYPQNPNESRMALICQKGKCEDGEIVYVDGTHYIGNMFNSAGFTTVNKDAIYKCKLGGNDRWEVVDSSKIPRCPDDLGDRIRIAGGPSGRTLGSRVAENLHTNVCFKPWNKICDVTCDDMRNEGKRVYCNGNVSKCYEYDWQPSVDDLSFCAYSDPENRISDEYTTSLEGNTSMVFLFFANKSFENGEFVGSGAVCLACRPGDYYDPNNGGACHSNLDEAWCNWRKNKENKNTEWKDDHCECLDSGMKWDTEKHDCVKKTGSGKTGSGKTGGGKTSGKTGSSGGKTGSGKQSGKSGKTGGGTTSDTKCGVKCNDANSGSIIYCDNKLYVCSREDATIDLFQWSFDYYYSVKYCEYTDPLTRVVGKYQKQIFVDSEYAVFGSRMLNNNEFVHDNSEDFKNFCLGCANGYYATNNMGWGCYADLDEAWCLFDNGVDAFHTKWNEKTKLCECTDDGLVWDNTKHTCVPDNGAGGDQQPQDGKIDCSFNLGATVKCRDGVQYNKNVSVSVSSATCDMYKSNVAKYLNEIAGLLCEKSGGVGNIITDAQVKAATDNINRFFEYAKSNANVWKNSEGKFNTARLASDATAGVILGTVGGIVSAHIIKKKQVEKGFDALNCTVGGQKVADWGDEFTIGFGR